MDELADLLRQYRELTGEMARLEAEKVRLREAIKTRVQQQGRPASIVMGDARIGARVKTSTTVTYDEEGLRRRLGERFRAILAPNVTKMRDHMEEVRPLVEPILDKIGSVSRERVQQAIESGCLKSEDFAGMFKKERKEVLYVRMEPMENGPTGEPPESGRW